MFFANVLEGTNQLSMSARSAISKCFQLFVKKFRDRTAKLQFDSLDVTMNEIASLLIADALCVQEFIFNDAAILTNQFTQKYKTIFHFLLPLLPIKLFEFRHLAIFK